MADTWFLERGQPVEKVVVESIGNPELGSKRK
jgi:hypothetical protein